MVTTYLEISYVCQLIGTISTYYAIRTDRRHQIQNRQLHGLGNRRKNNPNSMFRLPRSQRSCPDWWASTITNEFVRTNKVCIYIEGRILWYYIKRLCRNPFLHTIEWLRIKVLRLLFHKKKSPTMIFHRPESSNPKVRRLKGVGKNSSSIIE